MIDLIKILYLGFKFSYISTKKHVQSLLLLSFALTVLVAVVSIFVFFIDDFDNTINSSIENRTIVVDFANKETYEIIMDEIVNGKSVVEMNTVDTNENGNIQVLIVLDDYHEVNAVTKKIAKMSSDIIFHELKEPLDKSILFFIKFAVITFLILVYSINIVILNLVAKTNVDDILRNLYLLKVLGFNDKHTSIFLLSKLILIATASIVIAYCINISVIQLLINHLLTEYSIIDNVGSVNFINALSVIMVIVSLSIVVFITYLKSKNKIEKAENNLICEVKS